ncbi:sugar nucleotide-binding protein [Candidatus Woesearchaeota archaeon]|nr:sugar nucleotide-binding protein [Candidatus Woesearchaeota archaeon]
MKYEKILLTGGSGKLGQAILNSGHFPSLLSPPLETLDITKPETIKKFFDSNDIDAVIHCAALARMRECANEPAKAINVNILGTANLVMEAIKKEKKSGKKIRFIYISTDGVYPGIRGNYSEKDETIPYNSYGWTKLGAECAVNALSNFCIIRTNFFDPNNIAFEESATDMYTSKVTADYLAKAIASLLESDFVGTINVGGERKSDYDNYKEFKKPIKPCKMEDVLKTVTFPLARDASMDCSLWRKIEEKIKAK